MATNCGTPNCGCTNTYTVTAPCPPACAEVFNAQCIVYTGTDILCDTDIVIARYDYMDTVVTKIVNYFCARFTNAPVTIVEAGDSTNTIVTTTVVNNVTTYTIDSKTATVTAGDNVTVTSTGGGAPSYTTDYTIDAEKAIVALAVGEAVLTLVTTTNPTAHTTTYTFETDLTELDSIINAAIDDVFGNITTSSGLDANYDGVTQTLTIDFTGVAVDGVTITGDGTLADPLVAVPNIQKFVSGTYTGNQTVSHNLATTDVIVSICEAVLPPAAVYVHGTDYTYTIGNANEINITEVVPGGLGNYRVTVIG